MSIEKPYRQYSNIISLAKAYHRIVSNTIDGKLNNVKTTTFNTNTASSTISSALCNENSHISITPESAEALSAVGTAYIKSKTNGSFVVAHATTGTTQSYTISYTVTG